MPTHMYAIDAKYGTGSLCVNWIVFGSITLMPTLAFAASSSADVAFFRSMVNHSSQPTIVARTNWYSPAVFGSHVRVKPRAKSAAVTGEPSDHLRLSRSVNVQVFRSAETSGSFAA